MANFKIRVALTAIALVINVFLVFYLHGSSNVDNYNQDSVNGNRIRMSLSQILKKINLSGIRDPIELHKDTFQLPEKVVFHPVRLRLISNESKYMPLPHLTNPNSAKPCTTQAFVLLMINSRVHQLARRNAIRQSWGNGEDYVEMMKTPYAWHLLFIIGRSGDVAADRKVDEEARQYGDLVLGDFYDTMQNLTHKTILGMRWALTRCQPIYFFKGDDDVFLNQPRFFDYMGHLYIANSHRFWIGRVDQDWSAYRVVRDPKHKYYVSTKDYKERLFPHFCSGFAYVMSHSVLRDMVTVISNVTLLKTVDDAYVGILAKTVGVKPINNARFHLFIPPKPRHVYSEKEIDSSLAEHDIIQAGIQRKMLILARSAISRDLSPRAKLKAVIVDEHNHIINNITAIKGH